MDLITLATNDDLYAHLVTLGDTADAVADTLRAAGVKGERAKCDACPVARWLLATVDGAVSVEVDGNHVQLGTAVADRSTSYFCGLPPAVAAFIERFDNADGSEDVAGPLESQYPDLVEVVEVGY
jgi:hypothetical protein